MSGLWKKVWKLKLYFKNIEMEFTFQKTCHIVIISVWYFYWYNFLCQINCNIQIAVTSCYIVSGIQFFFKSLMLPIEKLRGSRRDSSLICFLCGSDSCLSTEIAISTLQNEVSTPSSVWAPRDLKNRLHIYIHKYKPLDQWSSSYKTEFCFLNIRFIKPCCMVTEDDHV